MIARCFACWPLLLASLGCAARSAPPAATGASGDSTSSGEAPSTPSAATSGGAVSAPGGAPALLPGAPLPGGEQPTPDKALPELRVEPLGMHVGGGKNSPEEKAPFHRALQSQFPAFQDCYRLAEDPWAGGSFGVDLKIARAGGNPMVEQPRTRIRGAGFQECMVRAFAKVQFEKPPGGPAVISYSVLFALGSKPKR